MAPQVLFVCVHNAGRSQMAAALFNHMSRGLAMAESAGTVPADRVDRTVAQAMQELGIDLTDHRPKLITQEQVDRAQRVFTMGCAIEEICPATFIPVEDWGLEDPKGEPLETVRRIRDQVAVRVSRLLEEMGVP